MILMPRPNSASIILPTSEFGIWDFDENKIFQYFNPTYRCFPAICEVDLSHRFIKINDNNFLNAIIVSIYVKFLYTTMRNIKFYIKLTHCCSKLLQRKKNISKRNGINLKNLNTLCTLKSLHFSQLPKMTFLLSKNANNAGTFRFAMQYLNRSNLSHCSQYSISFFFKRHFKRQIFINPSFCI